MKNTNTLKSFSDYTITPHAKQRMSERYNINSTKEIQKQAKSAREKGIDIGALNPSNYSALNISEATYHYLRNHYYEKSNHSRNYYYKDKVFVFGGHKSRTLLTVVPCTVSDIENKITKKSLNKQSHQQAQESQEAQA